MFATFALGLLPLLADAAPADAPAETAGATSPAREDRVALQTAVALNYCRTALHRIRSSPNPTVLAEERERILDNLSLDSIEDPEVIRLYSALLDEIGQIQLAKSQRQLVEDGSARGIRRQLAWDAVAFAGQVATAQYSTAIRTGADSWWDIRDRRDRRDSELLKIERDRLRSVTEKSTLFLDTFWTLARRRDIPDAWLVRGGDLDRLHLAVAETDDETRLRRLERMEPFLTAYPPYWYHLGRTQQQLGQFDDAIATYERLSTLEDGQFRIDEMLAAAEVNWALLLDQRRDPDAARIAARALTRAPDVWQANLAAAGIFERAGQIASAEDALLRNIDANIATTTSQTFRLAMLARQNETERLADLLSDPAVIASVPAPALLRCAAALENNINGPVIQRLSRSIAAYPRPGFASDDLILTADTGWNLPHATFRFPMKSRSSAARPEVAAVSGGHAVRFTSVELPSLDDEINVELSYPDGTQLVMTFVRQGRRSLRPVLMLSKATIGDRRLSFDATGLPRHAAVPVEWDIR